MIWPRQELPRRIVAGRLSGPETVPQRSREDLVTSTAANDTTLRTGPTYLKNVYAFGLTGAGTRTAGFAIAAVIARPIGGIVADKVGPRIVVAFSLAGAAVMSLVIALRLPPELAAGTSFVLMALFLGLGTVASLPGSPSWHQPNESARSPGLSALPAGWVDSSLRWPWELPTTRQHTATPSDWSC
jgi:MFS family permease